MIVSLINHRRPAVLCQRDSIGDRFLHLCRKLVISIDGHLESLDLDGAQLCVRGFHLELEFDSGIQVVIEYEQEVLIARAA